MTPSTSEKRAALVVDNQQEWRQQLTNLLGSEFSLACVESYTQALQVLDSQNSPFHVVITEIRLDETREREEGFALAEEINARGEHTRVIFLSRYTSNENANYVRRAYKEFGAFDYVEKTPQINVSTPEGQKFLDRVREAAEEAERSRNIFVAMPFAKKYEPFYEQVKNILKEEMGLDCQRADDVFRPGIVMDHILQGIQGSSIVIADLSGANANVNFEVGIAHAKRKSVLLLTRDSAELSKKLLGNLRYLVYEDSIEGANQLRRDLTRAIRDIQDRNHPADFKRIEAKRDLSLCFALQPESEDAKDTHERIIQPVANSNGLSQCIRVQEIFSTRVFLHTIWERINQANLVVTDLTGINTDTCYLSGQAYGLEKPMVVIARKGEKLPFDFLAGRPIFFSKQLQRDCDQAKQELAAAIQALNLNTNASEVNEDATTQPPQPAQQDMTPAISQSDRAANPQSGIILIVAVTKVEIQSIWKVFRPRKRLSREVIGDKTYYNLGEHGGATVYMVQSEMGTATAGGTMITTHRAIQDMHPQAVILCGIAYGLRPDKQKLGDILIAKQLQNYEHQKIDMKLGKIPRGDRVTASERLLDRFRSGDIEWNEIPTHFGLVLSGEKLVNDPEFRNWLLENEPEAIGGEMEGTGLYIAARSASVDWIMVKAICDWADGKKDDTAQKLAAFSAAKFVLHVLKLGGWNEI